VLFYLPFQIPLSRETRPVVATRASGEKLLLKYNRRMDETGETPYYLIGMLSIVYLLAETPVWQMSSLKSIRDCRPQSFIVIGRWIASLAFGKSSRLPSPDTCSPPIRSTAGDF